MNIDIHALLKQKRKITKLFPFKSTSYFLNLIIKENDGLFRQIIPSEDELKSRGMSDPLYEEKYMPVPNLVHRYPNRVLLLTTNDCFGYCRFCTRKRNWGVENKFFDNFDKIFEYLTNHKEITEVILSGGDPLLLDLKQLKKIFEALNKIDSIKIVRIGSRILTFNPLGITNELLNVLNYKKILFFLTHFNHPNEITEKTIVAVQKIRERGLILLNQSVLLKGINDAQAVLESLSFKLLSCGIKPYALHHLDKTLSTQHFRVSIHKGRRLIKEMRKNFSGIGIPYYVLDQPKGKGKKFL